ncbi:hypothetical protein PQX77_010365 [Marasmius sp. AFHP31]|nr:hypothetical protein PQX77_010365 [Marasmius sp. AFHP31]
MHVKLLELHRQYGPIVRIGPNELSICDVDAIQPVLGNNGMGKGPMWEGRHSARDQKIASLVGIREVAHHLRRRKPWNKALGTAGVKAYEPILRARLVQLVEIFDGKAARKEVFDGAKWLSFFSYDFMGDMAFRAGFELMRDGDKDGLWKIMEAGITVLSYTQHVYWLAPLLNRLPGLGSNGARLVDFVGRIAKARVENGADLEGEDISTYLLDEKSQNPEPLPFNLYAGEALLALVAGSDTAAITMSCVFFYILDDKSLFGRLRAEIDAAFPFEKGMAPHEDTAKLATLPFLNAVINEALRIQPPVPSGLQRAPEPGSGGKMIGSVFVSEDTAVHIAPYALHRDPRYFSPDPDRFWPDRWLVETKGEVELNQAAFIPFSIGPMNCVGKALAQVELRAVIATLVQRFDMDLKAGWDRTLWERELEDYFVLRKGALPICMQKRIL